MTGIYFLFKSFQMFVNRANVQHWQDNIFMNIILKFFSRFQCLVRKCAESCPVQVTRCDVMRNHARPIRRRAARRSSAGRSRWPAGAGGVVTSCSPAHLSAPVRAPGKGRCFCARRATSNAPARVMLLQHGTLCVAWTVQSTQWAWIRMF